MFGKIHTDIFNSSLIAEGGWLPTYVFMCMVTLSDKDGNLPVDPRVLYRQIGCDTGERVSLEAFMEAVEFLSSEDRGSNLATHSGRRIIPLAEVDDHEGNRGFLVVNKAHYRDKDSIEQRRENDAERKRRQRAKEKAAQADEQEAKPDELKRGDQPKPKPKPTKPKCKPTRFADFWKAYPRRTDDDECEQIWVEKKLDEIADKIIADVKHREANDPEWLRDDGRFIPGSVKYLKSDRWQDNSGANAKKPPKESVHLEITETVHVWIPDEILARATDEERAEYERIKAINLESGYTEPDWDSPKVRAIVKQEIEDIDNANFRNT